ncbi:MAG: transketolase family protein [Spirochaetales bacterium]|nr:MAG: transketolase family protein [Spirochaetales bacterium]
MAVKSMREAYGDVLIELAEEDDRIVVVDADLSGANGTRAFARKFPGRHINVGVAESNMVGIAAGLSAAGKIPFASSFAVFASRRVFDQFFISANYAGLNVKLTGSDPGISALYNGGTHQCFEDMGIMRTVPGLVVFEPCDNVSLRGLVREAAAHQGCTYMRLHRKDGNLVYPEGETFALGRAKILADGTDAAIICAGFLIVPECVKAAAILKGRGISAAVIDMHTLKPLDKDTVLKYAEKTGAIVTCENHQILNGLGSAVAEVLSENLPTFLKRLGVNDEFGEVGDQEYLMHRFGFTAAQIAEKTEAFLKEKR